MKLHNAEKIGVIGSLNLPKGRALKKRRNWHHFVGVGGTAPCSC